MPEVIQFTADMTLWWPCRRGDLLLWFRYDNPIGAKNGLQCYDSWQMRDGSHVRITNRLEDFPSWFQLHPLEISGRLVYKLMGKIEGGDYPEAPIDGPNLWRLRSGDRLVWLGDDRAERRSVNGILSILNFAECALAVGEQEATSLEEFVGFGAPIPEELSPEFRDRWRAAKEAVEKMGSPLTWSPEWRLG
jgi:hypothetical protein